MTLYFEECVLLIHWAQVTNTHTYTHTLARAVLLLNKQAVMRSLCCDRHGKHSCYTHEKQETNHQHHLLEKTLFTGDSRRELLVFLQTYFPLIFWFFYLMWKQWHQKVVKGKIWAVCKSLNQCPLVSVCFGWNENWGNQSCESDYRQESFFSKLKSNTSNDNYKWYKTWSKFQMWYVWFKNN